MYTNYCPKTCSQLSVSAILISIGIIQFLAGIILLNYVEKSSKIDVYLLSGTDFIAAASNISVGCLLGITASMWEKKKKVTSMKNTARQNVLAGLYIAALSMNAIVAIIMILGDGSKLLMSKNNNKDSGELIFEVLGCAYVTSVCSPIVCLVIALVCLSGNRIQIYENMKQKDSISKKESYRWVFENNHDNTSRSLGAVIQDSSTRNESVSDDNVFLEKRSASEKLFKLKPSKKTKEKDSSNTFTELKSPLEIWAYKRNKILQEITSPKPIFFADDYLQFPDYKYESYIGTMIPRITETSFIRASGHDSSQNSERKMAAIERAISYKPLKPHLDELNMKLASRRTSYPNSAFHNEIDCSEVELSAVPKTVFADIRNSIDELSDQSFHFTHCKVQRTHAKSIGQIETKRLKRQSDSEFEAIESPQLLLNSRELVGNRNSLEWLQNTYNMRRNSNGSSSSGLTAETISELKAKINKRNFDEDGTPVKKSEFLKSFKQDGKRKSNLSESDIENKRSAFQKLHEKYGVFAQNSEIDPEITLAGEVVPISIRPTAINRSNSIPLKTIHSQAPNRYSVNLKNKESGQSFETGSNEAKLSYRNMNSDSSQEHSSSRNYKSICTDKSEIESNNLIKRAEKRSDFKQKMSVMGSIAESPPEGIFQNDRLSKFEKRSSNSSPEENNERDSSMHRIRQARNSFSIRRLSSMAAPKLLNRLWSMKRSETTTDLTSLIMDSDSLVGLTDEELMARTRRLRQLRRSVELRSKVDKHDDVV